MAMITLGTGGWQGLILDGKIYRGENGIGGGWDTLLHPGGRRCSCGMRGCFEAYCSGSALADAARWAMARYPQSAMWRLCGGVPERADGRTAFEAMRLGDLAGRRIVMQFQKDLAVGIANLVRILQPEVICLGGGIAREGETLLRPVRRELTKLLFGQPEPTWPRLCAAALGGDAGILARRCLAGKGNVEMEKTRESACIKWKEAVDAFALPGCPTACVPYGSGHINDTFLLRMDTPDGNRPYILQRLNHTVYRKPEEVMENILGVTVFLRKRSLPPAGIPLRETMNLIPRKDGGYLYQDSIGSYWRVYVFVENAVCLDAVEHPQDFYESGWHSGGFKGCFRTILPAHCMKRSPPSTIRRIGFKKFCQAVAADPLAVPPQYSQKSNLFCNVSLLPGCYSRRMRRATCRYGSHTTTPSSTMSCWTVKRAARFA